FTLTGDAISDDYAHDEALTALPVRPLAVVLPGSTAEVASVVRVCDELRVPVTARGAGTGLSGACIPRADGVVCSLERMNAVLEAVLANGDVIRTGGKFVKATTGYDLTQLIIGSEGTLAIVTEATLRIYPRAQHNATVLIPFASVDEVAAAVPPIVRSGVNP